MPITIPYMRKEDITPELVLARIAHVCQSKKELRLDLSLKIYASTLHSFEGCGNDDEARFENYCHFKRTIVEIKNRDSMCLQRCVK
jgi:hypothetical protein